MYSERAKPCNMKPGHPAKPSRQLHAGWAPGCRVDVQLPHPQKLKHGVVRADSTLIILFCSKSSYGISRRSPLQLKVVTSIA